MEDLNRLSIAELHELHQKRDALIQTLRAEQQDIHDAIVVKERAEFKPGPAHLAQKMGAVTIEDMTPSALESLRDRVTDLINRKKGDQ